MSTTKLKERITAFLLENKIKTYMDESMKGVRGGGVNVTVDHYKKLTTEEFKKLIKSKFPKAKIKYGHWENWTNLTFYL